MLHVVVHYCDTNGHAHSCSVHVVHGHSYKTAWDPEGVHQCVTGSDHQAFQREGLHVPLTRTVNASTVG